MRMLWGILKEKIPFGIVISFLVGVVFGLVVLGWWLWPVRYVDTDPHSLRERHKETYVQMAADSYELTGDLATAQARLRELEKKGVSAEDVAAYVAEVAAKRRAAGEMEEARRLQKLATALGVKPVAAPAATPTQAPTKEAAPSARSRLLRTCLQLLFVLLVVVGILLIWSYLRRRKAVPKLAKLGRRAAPARPAPVPLEEEEEEIVGGEERKPVKAGWEAPVAQPSLGHFVTTFELGDDGYDESFGIETESGEFLGECGVAISELIGSGAPEKPTAFDIWLFDKSDIRTVTKVVASPYAYEDDTLRAKLGAKGEVVMAEKGETIILETASLRVRAEIIDLTYGGGDLPPESYFTKFTIELAPSQKTMG